MLTYDRIKLIAPRAWDGYVDALVAGQPVLATAGITTPLRMAHFMAQFFGHEINGMTIVRENTRWTADQIKGFTGKRYANLHPRILLCRGDAKKLANVVYTGINGNSEPDDGWRFRGGGPPQLTGREIYRECGEAIGVDLENHPEQIEDPTVGVKAAVWEWDRKKLNRFADRNYGRTIGNAINRGNPFSKYDPIGYQSREQWFKRVWAVLGEGQPLPDGSELLHLGAYGGVVERIQAQLRDLGYQLGDQDGVYGSTMARAVAGFKRDQAINLGVELEPGDTIGPLTLAALDTADRIALSPERTNITARELTAMGSQEMAAGGHMEAVGRGLAAGGTVGLLQQTGALDGVAGLFQQISLLQSTAAPAVRAISWGMQNFWWVLLLGGGVYCWRSGALVKLARLAAHQLGFNLSR